MRKIGTLIATTALILASNQSFAQTGEARTAVNPGLNYVNLDCGKESTCSVTCWKAATASPQRILKWPAVTKVSAVITRSGALTGLQVHDNLIFLGGGTCAVDGIVGDNFAPAASIATEHNAK